MRKIVQISTNHQSGRNEELTIFALCSDGTLWYTISGTEFGDVPGQKQDDWSLAANVPQDNIDKDRIFTKQGYR